MGLLILLLVGIGVAASLTGDDKEGSDSSASPNGQTIRGIAVLVDMDGGLTGAWDECYGTGGYSDFDEGVPLSVKNGSGDIVGSGSVVNVSDSNIEAVARADVDSAELSADRVLGSTADDSESAAEEIRDFLIGAEGDLCALYFEADVDKADYYSIELGSRGEINYSRADLAEAGYVVGITLGDL